MNKFNSIYKHVGSVALPEFSGTRIMMMPIILGDLSSIPIAKYHRMVGRLFEIWPKHQGEVGYLTIDERLVHAGRSHRVPGKHIDSPCEKGFQMHGGGGTPPRHGGGGTPPRHGGGGGEGTGMLLVSDVIGCKAWQGTFIGEPGLEGECDHLADQCIDGEVMQPNQVYWCDGNCVHESLKQSHDVRRSLVRLSMPSKAPWFKGFSENPLGVKPTGPIRPRRPLLDY